METMSESSTKHSTQPLNKEQLTIRRAEALELRLKGWTYRRIAAEQGVDVRTAWDDVDKAMAPAEAVYDAAAERARAIELLRLDRIVEALWPRVIGEKPDGTFVVDDFGLDRYLKVSDRRSKLMGLDAPEKHELVGGEIVLEVIGTEVRLVEDGAKPELGEGATQLMELETWQCGWLVVQGDQSTRCDRLAPAGQPFCEEHGAVARPQGEEPWCEYCRKPHVECVPPPGLIQTSRCRPELHAPAGEGRCECGHYDPAGPSSVAQAETAQASGEPENVAETKAGETDGEGEKS